MKAKAAKIALDAVFVANRGDPALRVIRTAKQLGLWTAVACTEAELRGGTLATDAAHYAVALPPSPSLPYLNVAGVCEAAQRFRRRLAAALGKAEADALVAVHPGWGFLSERAEFAAALQEVNLRWCGPSPQAMQIMGEKARARETMQSAGVPVVPGYHARPGDSERELQQAAQRQVGFPLIIKPVYGGGGKGMRIVRREDEFAAALASARREAKYAFGDDTMLLERYVEQARHVEFQVFGGGGGEGERYRAVHLYERDCSVQRRHQKIIEEAPGPALTESLRQRMGRAAVQAAEAVQYTGAGTVEFLLDAERDEFWFMEMNTRLQVEHPVTEMAVAMRAPVAPREAHCLHDVDLVEWQLRVAAGEPLPVRRQEDVVLRSVAPGVQAHAIEARIYAEAVDAQGQFLPQSGRIHTFLVGGEPPERVWSDEDVRVDVGVRVRDQVSLDYDPMIAKVIVRAAGRPAAIERLDETLSRMRVGGIATNAAFVRAVLRDEEFRHGMSGQREGVCTTWLEQRMPRILERLRQEAERREPLAVGAATRRLEQDAGIAAWRVLQQLTERHGALTGVANDGHGDYTAFYSEVERPPADTLGEEKSAGGTSWRVRLRRERSADAKLPGESAAETARGSAMTWAVACEAVDVDDASPPSSPPAPYTFPITALADGRVALDGVASRVPTSWTVEPDAHLPDADAEIRPRWRVRVDQRHFLVHSPLSFFWQRYAAKRRPEEAAIEGVVQQRAPASGETAAARAPRGHVQSPMPGRLLELFVQVGQRVKAGDAVAAIEAMKMEHTMRAPFAGVVSQVTLATPGAFVPAGADLVVLQEEQAESQRE